MKRNFHSHSFRSGLTGGWLLAVLAVLAVVVIIVLFVWRPGAAPSTPGTTPSTPVEDPLAPEDAADGAGNGGEPGATEGEGPAGFEEAEPGEDPPADEGEEPADGEEPAEDGPPDEEEPGDGAAAEDEPPGPVDATVETDEPLQADVRNREADFGGVLAGAVERATGAIEQAEERLAGLESASRGPAAEAPSFEPDEEPPAEERVRQAETAGGPSSDRARSAREAVAGAVRTRPEEVEAAVDLGSSQEEQDVSEARVRDVQAAGANAGERTRSIREAAAGAVRTRPEGAEASVELGDAARGTASPTNEARIVTLEAGNRGEGALDRARTDGDATSRTRSIQQDAADVELSASGAADAGGSTSETQTRSVAVDAASVRERLETYEMRTRESLQASTTPVVEGGESNGDPSP